MEKQLKCVFELSLEEMSLRRVAVLLCSDSDILASISYFLKVRFPTDDSKELRDAVENKIKDKMLKLKLPKSLMEQVIDNVLPIGLEIRRWEKFHQAFFLSSHEEIDSAKLCWTTAGTIDYRKTAEEHLRCNVFYVLERYKLACFYCLENYIPLLWEELPKRMKKNYYNKKGNFLGLEFCWPHILEGEHSKLDYLLRKSDTLTSFNQWAFEHSAEGGNKSAAEYFFQKLTHEEREASLMRTVHAVLANRNREQFLNYKPSDVPCYLLSLMTPEQQMEIVKVRPIDVLLCFLDSPRQDLFAQNAALIYTFLPPSGYYDLLGKMADRFINSDHYFPKLFQEFFDHSPLDLKKYFLDFESGCSGNSAYRFLCMFFVCYDSDSVEVIFRNVDAADRVKLVFRLQVRLFDFMLEDRWQIVEVCLRETTLSKEDRERWKAAFMEHLKFVPIGQIECPRWKWKKFFESFDETDASSDSGKEGQKHNLENCCPE